MKQQDDRKRTSALTLAIRAIIIVIFCVAVAIGIVKLAQAHRESERGDKLQQELEQTGQEP